ncbi:MAG: hypothetical protein IKR84_03860, partial [Oscillibacter sp.]|nr:hypothetical protein [Oscillibacter sp.]
MDNRYIRNDRGTYTRITEDDGKPHHPPHGPPPEAAPPPHGPPEVSEAPHGPPPPPVRDGLQGFFRHLLNVSHAENVDTGDLLLLCLLFLLYR